MIANKSTLLLGTVKDGQFVVYCNFRRRQLFRIVSRPSFEGLESSTLLIYLRYALHKYKTVSEGLFYKVISVTLS